jgi:hypothetical protein
MGPRLVSEATRHILSTKNNRQLGKRWTAGILGVAFVAIIPLAHVLFPAPEANVGTIGYLAHTSGW